MFGKVQLNEWICGHLYVFVFVGFFSPNRFFKKSSITVIKHTDVYSERCCYRLCCRKQMTARRDRKHIASTLMPCEEPECIMEQKKVHHKHSSHWRVYLLIYLICFPHWIWFFFLFLLNVLLKVWDLEKVWLLFLTCDFFSPLIFVYDGCLLERYNITVCSYRWSKQGLLIFIKSKGMFQCHFICPSGIKCCVKCISFSDIANGEKKLRLLGKRKTAGPVLGA